MDEKNQMSVYAEKLREVVKVIIFMIRKGKRKFIVDLNLALKRSKLAGKSLIGKLSHHHHNHHNSHQEPDYYSAAGVFNYPEPKSSDYVEFSCSNTPAHHNHHSHHNFLLSHVIIPSLHLINGKKNGNGGRGFKTQYETVEEEFEKAVESALNESDSTGSPVLPGLGFGRSPGPVRQLRVTDSPFPVFSTPSRDSSAQVDAQAEAFIKRFYSQLQRQPITEG